MEIGFGISYLLQRLFSRLKDLPHFLNTKKKKNSKHSNVSKNLGMGKDMAPNQPPNPSSKFDPKTKEEQYEESKGSNLLHVTLTMHVFRSWYFSMFIIFHFFQLPMN